MDSSFHTPQGILVRLRPFRPDEFEFVWSAHQATRGERGISTPRGAKEQLQRLVRHSGSFVDNVLYLAVEASGRLVGEVDVRRVSTGLPSGVVELGIGFFDDQSRGKGFGTEAVALVVGHLFDAEEVERIEARTAVDNDAMCRLLAKLGFVREGVLRAYMARGSDRVRLRVGCISPTLPANPPDRHPLREFTHPTRSIKVPRRQTLFDAAYLRYAPMRLMMVVARARIPDQSGRRQTRSIRCAGAAHRLINSRQLAKPSLRRIELMS